jgi:hypothetical protein
VKPKVLEAVVKPVAVTPENNFRKIQDDITYFSNLYKLAEKLTKEKETEYYAKLSKDKDGQFYLNMLKQGTMSDKIAALAAII